MKHYSVLLNESIEGLNIKADGIYVDGTLGRGGHSLEIAKRLTTGHLYCFDRDETAIIESKERLSAYLDRITFIHAPFSQLKEALAEHQVFHIDGLMLDLGVSSPQFDEASRGFSYRFDAPLDMRMDQSQSYSAKELVNEADFHELYQIFSRYGEEPFAKQIARKIEAYRQNQPIETTFQLVDIIKSALPAKVLNKKGHPAKKSFQALRVAVNQELQELETVLDSGMELLNVGGRICVISFQSLEDRIVKDRFSEVSKPKKTNKRIPQLVDEEMPFKTISRKPIVANEAELAENQRSHSAKLRIVERVK